MLTEDETSLMAQVFVEWMHAYNDNSKYDRTKDMESLVRHINEKIKNKRREK